MYAPGKYFQVSGRGAVSTHEVKAMVQNAPRRVYVDPKIRYNKKERLGYGLRKKFEGRPFDFFSRFEKFIIKYKSKFYVEIFNELLAIYKKNNCKVSFKHRINKIVFPSNRFSVLTVDDTVVPEGTNPIRFKQPKLNFMNKDYITIKKNKNRKSREYKKLLREVFVKFSKKEDVIVRNPILLVRLKNKIRNLVINRCKKQHATYLRNKKLDYLDDYYRFTNQHPIKLEANMDEKQMGAQGEQICPEISTTGNVLNEATRDASKGVPAKRVPRKKKVYNKLASAESSPDYANLTDRFFPHSTVEWKSGQIRGDKLFDLTLPLDFITSHPNSPNCVLFNSYAYWDGDFEVKLMVNANKFQVGQLQMAWYYGQDYEFNFDRRDNVYTASQQAHCLVSAATSNEGILYVPFRYYKPKMGTKMRSDDPGRLNMGRLTVRVLNQLSSTSTSYNACTVTLSFRFINSNFSGMIARDLGTVSRLEHQMFSRLAVKAAMSMLEELDMDPQRDNPPLVKPPMSMVPWSAHSWSVGDLIAEPINPLRLQAIGQTPHPAEVTPEKDEMTIDTIKQVFGLIRTVSWKTSMRSGDQIFSLAASPNIDYQNYTSYSYDNSICYPLTPIHVLSNLYAYWRGTIKIRLDIIASFCHTGRLLVAYVPRVLENPTMEQLKSCPHSIFDLQGENRQMLFEVPFIADRPWWHTKGFGNNILPPAHIYCVVLNELIPMDNVPKEVDINLYMAGCDDLEFSVPVCPRIGLSTYNAFVDVPRALIASTKSGYTPMYIGEWRNYHGGEKIILRYGEVTDHIVQFENLKPNKIYIPDDDMNGGKIKAKFVYKKLKSDIVETTYDSTSWAIILVDVGDNYQYATVMSIKDAQAFLADPKNHEPYTFVKTSDFFIKEKSGQKAKDIKFKELEVTNRHGFVMVHQMDERTSVTTCEQGMLPMVSSTQHGRLTFGESFDNLKVLCRRYQLYTHYEDYLKTDSSIIQQVKFPIMPQGLYRSNADIKKFEYYNYNREGFIPIIASAYRFYRGGLRFRLVWRANWNCSIRIEHRPDERLENWYIQPKEGHRQNYNDGYAILIQNTSINNVLEFEVPFYQCGILGLLQHPNIKDDLESYHFTLGNIYISFACSDPKTRATRPVIFDLYYSLADDCRFSVFQGFPPMMQAPDHSVSLEPQMGIFSDVKETFSNFKESSGKINKIAEKVDRILPEEEQPSTSRIIDEEGNRIKVEEAKTSIFDWITKFVPKQLKTVMINGLSQIMHCFINPTLKTISWAFASFLVTIGVLCTDMIDIFSKQFTKLTNWLKHFRSNETKPSTVGNPEKIIPQMGEREIPSEITAGVSSTIVASICAGLGCVGRLPKTIPDFCHGVWNNMAKFTFTANHLCTFFKNNLTWITKSYKWVIRKLFPNKALAVELEGADTELREFTQEALILLDETNARKIEVHPRWNMRVYTCAAQASALMMKMASTKNIPRSPAILTVMRDVMKKRDELTRFQLSPPIRFEPFVLYVEGASNIGKSHMCQEVGKDMLRSINYKTYEELIYTRTPGNAYWNQLRNQPICLYDDFYAVGGEYGLQQAAELFCLKSRAVFNPPQADIKDKFIRYNPLIVMLASNMPYPKIAGVEHPEALYRRRDLLVKVSPNREFYDQKNVNPNTGSPRQFRSKDIKNFEHLLFAVYDDPKDAESSVGPTMNYEQFKEHLLKQFTLNYERELELYKNALKEAYSFYPDDEEELYTIDEVVKRQNTTIKKINETRLENMNENKIFLMSTIANYKNLTPRLQTNTLPILSSMLQSFRKFDKFTHEEMVSSCTKFREDYTVYINDMRKAKMSNKLIAQMYSDSDDDNDEDVMKSKEQLKKEVDDQEASTSAEIAEETTETIAEAIKRLPLRCIHSNFKSTMEFIRDEKQSKAGKTCKLMPIGYFTDGVEKISERTCELADECVWGNPDTKQRIMNRWLLDKYCPERIMLYKRKDVQNLPYIFYHELTDRVTGTIPESKDSKFKKLKTAVYNELSILIEWFGKVISSIGSGLWSAIKYAGSIICVISAIMGFAGLCYQACRPEAAEVRKTQAMVDNKLIYEVARQGTSAGYDALHTLNAQLVTGTHSSQVDYPSSNIGESQMLASGDYKTFGKLDKSNIRDVAIKVIGNLSKEKELAVTRIIRRNTMFLKALYGTKEIVGRIVGIFDHYAIAAAHYHDKFSTLPDDARVYLCGSGFQIPVTYDKLKFTMFKDSGVGYYKLPLQIPAFRDILKHMARQNDHRHVGPMSRLIEPLEDGSCLITNEYCQRINGVCVEASNGFKEFIIQDGYRYARGGRGVCGSILVSDHLERPIYGIHVAGDIAGRCGMSEALTYEQFEHLLEGVVIRDTMEPQMDEYNSGFMKPQTNCLVLGVVPPMLGHRETGNSKVIPTECSGEIFPVYCAPPVLSQRDPRISENPYSPMQEGINKEGMVPLNFPIEYVEMAFQDLKRLICAKVKPVRHCVGKLPKSIAVVGDPHIEGFDKLDFNTSEGFPFVSCRQGNQKSKSWLLNLKETQNGYEYGGCDPLLTQIMKMKKEQRLRRELPFTVFTTCLKDRKLTLENSVKPGKVRIFSISPIDYTIQCRQNFMDFTVSYQNTRLDVEHAVGIDVNSYEWTQLAQKLMNNGDKIVTADYSGFGPTLNAVCAKYAFDIIRAWYVYNGDTNSDNDLTREMMGYECIYSVLLTFSTMYRTFCGLPSGGPLTVICNSLVNCIYIRVAWQIIFTNNLSFKSLKDSNVNATLQSFRKNVVMVVYGDDLIMSVKDEAAEHFNCVSIAKVLNNHGIIVKNASKKDEIIKYSTLLDDNTTFLKNKFIPHPTRKGLFMAALDKTSVEDTLNFTFKEWQYKLREISLEASEACIRSAYGHGPDYFNSVRNKVFEYWLQKGEHMDTPTWNQIDDQNFG